MKTISLGYAIIVCLCVLHVAVSESAENSYEEPEIYYTVVCQNRNMQIACFNGKVIEITMANYGRSDQNTCPKRGEMDDVNCRALYSMDIVSERCNGRDKCTVPVNNGIFGGDPCRGTRKYLEVQYECLESQIPVSTTINQTVMQTTTTVEPTKQKPVTTPTQPHRISLPTLPPPLIIETTQQPEETTDSKFKTTKVEVKVTTDRRRLYCPAVKVRDIDWPETLTGSGNVIKQCPSGTTGEASWDCNGSPAEWTPASGPDLSACKSPWVNFITGRVDDIEDPDDIIQISEMLVTGTEPDKKLYGGDIKGCIDVIDQLPIALEEQLKDLNQVERQKLVSNTADGNLITGSNLLSNEHNDAWLDLSPKEQTQEAAKLLNGMETNGFLVARELPEGQVKTKVTDNIVMEVAVSKTSNLPDDGSVIFPGTKGIVNSSDSIVLSDVSIKARSTNGSAKLVFLMYNNIGHFLEGIDGVGNDTNSSVKLINSRVISASLNTMHSQSLVEPVIITLEHIKNDRRNPVCSYWNASGGSGSWSNSGCETVESNETHTICSCNHLTNFAVLMDVHGTLLPFSHHFALSVITYAGFMISIICLILCLMTFCGFKNLQCDRNTIHKNLCFCLLVAEVLFMAGIDKTEKLLPCTIIAACLHYFFLAAFAWMSLEGIQLYVMLVEVFEAEHSRRKYYYPYGYGLPAVIVGVSAGIFYEGYGTDSVCWLTVNRGFIWAFVGPICLVILINLIFLIMAGVIMCRHTVSPANRNNDKINKLRAWLKGACVLLCLLGITWVFGMLYINKSTVIMAYVFTILNAVQGVFIFVFHCMMNEKVTKEYKRWIRQSRFCPDCIRDIYATSISKEQVSRSSTSSKKLHGIYDRDPRSFSTASTVTDKRFSVSSTGKNNGDPNVRYTPVLQEEKYVLDEIDEGKHDEDDSIVKVKLEFNETPESADSDYETLQNNKNRSKTQKDDYSKKSKSDPQLQIPPCPMVDYLQHDRRDSRAGLVGSEELPESTSPPYFKSMPNLTMRTPRTVNSEVTVDVDTNKNKSMPNLVERSDSYITVTGLKKGASDYNINRPLTIHRGTSTPDIEYEGNSLVRMNSDNYETFV